MKKLHIGTSPLTGSIYCGDVAKDGMTWLSNKTDVTGEACAAVAQHVLMNDGKIVVTCNGQPAYEIIVKDLQVPA